VLMTTHDVGDIEQLCSRLLIVDHGKLLYDGGLDQIRERFGTDRHLVVDLIDGDVVDGVPLLVAPAVEVRADGPRRWLRFSRQDTTAPELIAAVVARYRVQDISIEDTTIEEIIRRIYETGI